MRKDKILLQVSSLEQVRKYEELGLSNFLFPLEDFSVGYAEFSLGEIAESGVKAHILVNRLLTDDDIDHFLKLDFPSNVVGFVVEDTGIFVELVGKGYELISFQNHLNNNYETINYWLEYFDSLIISTDITLEEVKEILKRTKKPLVLNAFGHPMTMYSRRKLVSNYYSNFALEEKKNVTLNDPKGEASFRLIEGKYGTACFDERILDVRSLLGELDDDKILYYLVNSGGISEEDLENAIDGRDVEGTTTGFFFKKTVYRIGDLK